MSQTSPKRSIRVRCILSVVLPEGVGPCWLLPASFLPRLVSLPCRPTISELPTFHLPQPQDVKTSMMNSVGNYDFGDLEPLDTSIHRGFQNGLRPSHPIDHPASSASMPLPAKAAAPETTRVVPSKLHLALAIAVVQSKPAELTVEGKP